MRNGQKFYEELFNDLEFVKLHDAKTEITNNLIDHLSAAGKDIQIVDDLVNKVIEYERYLSHLKLICFSKQHYETHLKEKTCANYAPKI